MTLLLPTRRGLITGLASLLVAAPAIVRAASIMQVKAVEWWPEPVLRSFNDYRGYYKLVGRKVVPCGLMEWAKSFGKQHIAMTSIGGRTISTVFLGMDRGYPWSVKGAIVFETMVFRASGKPDETHREITTERYCTYEEAEAGHRAMVARIEAIGKLGKP